MTVRYRRALSISVYVLMPVTSLVLLCFGLAERSRFALSGTCPGSGCVRTITVFNPSLYEALETGAAVLALALLVAGVVAAASRLRWLGLSAILVATIGYPASCTMSLQPENWMAWRPIPLPSSATQPGRILVAKSWLGEVELCIGERWTSSLWRQSTIVLACGLIAKEHDDFQVPLVLAQNRRLERTIRLRRCSDYLLATASGQAFVAYDEKRRQPLEGHRLYSLSPFACLAPNERPHPADVAGLTTWVDGRCKGEFLPRDLAALKTGLSHGLHHACPEVRTLSERLLERVKSMMTKQLPR